jgi:hypothetical protein
MNILSPARAAALAAATFDLLRSKGHQVVGHSTRQGSDDLVSEISPIDGAPERSVDAAIAASAASTRWSTMPASIRRSQRGF